MDASSFETLPQSLEDITGHITGVFAEYLWKTLYTYGKEKQTRAKLQLLVEAQKAINNEWLTEYLRWKYQDHQLLTRNGRTYPVAVFPAHATHVTDIESALKHPIADKPSRDSFIVRNDSFRTSVHNLFLLDKDFNSRTYSMKELTTRDGKPQMECQFGTYFDSYDTSEVLEWEIRKNTRKLAGVGESAFRRFEAHLPLRRRLHQAVADPVCNSEGRNPAVGIATLIAYKESNGPEAPFQLMVRRRAAKGVPLRAGLLHVLPSFMFQPTTTHGVESEYSVKYNILREVLEEIYSYPGNTPEVNPNIIYNFEQVRHLEELY
jgi:hypothetical protein